VRGVGNYPLGASWRVFGRVHVVLILLRSFCFDLAVNELSMECVHIRWIKKWRANVCDCNVKRLTEGTC